MQLPEADQINFRVLYIIFLGMKIFPVKRLLITIQFPGQSCRPSVHFNLVSG
jgi:hypothetical protein